MDVLVATSNSGKVREFRAILEGSGLELEFRPSWIGHEEPGDDYLENARAKALAVVRYTGRPALAEDAGIEVDALGGLPGSRSARFSGLGDEANNAKLLRLLDGVPDERRTARYRAVAVLLLPDGREAMGEGTFEGRIAAAPRGTGGFGYDPLFVPAGQDGTVGEMSREEKDAVSHRAQALRELVECARRAGML